METIITVVHRRNTWTCKELYVTQRSIEVEVTGRRGKVISLIVFQRNFNGIASAMYEIRDINEERIVSSPVLLNENIIYINRG